MRVKMKWWWVVAIVCAVGVSAQETLEERLAEERVLEAKDLLSNFNFKSISPFGLLQAIVDELKAQKSDDEEYKKDLEVCAHAAFHVLGSAKQMEMWALKMIDSGTKAPSGLLMGNLVDLGQFDECTRISAQDTNQSFSGQHCLVVVEIAGVANIPISDGITVGNMSGGDLKATVAQCVPSVCKSHIVEVGFRRVLKPLNEAINKTGIVFTPFVEQKDCHTAEPPPLEPEDWAVMIVILLLLFVCSAGTAIDLKRGLWEKAASNQITPKEQCILAFSAYYNGKKLLSMKKSPDQMAFINGIKFMSICWVLLGHRYKYLISEPVVNFLDLPDEIKKYSKMFLLSAPLSVDSFFMIGGLLNMYSFCKIREKKKEYTYKDVLISYVHRYLRLTPSYMMVMAIIGTWFYRVGDGPYWDRLVGSEKANCRNNGYWWNLLYINNYYPYNYCMMQSWYLSADMQMFWVSPFVMYPLWRWPLAGCGLLGVLLVLSIVSPFMVSLIYAIKMPMPLTADPDEIYRIFKYYYLPTHVKCCSYVIGIAVGALLYLHKEGKLKVHLKWWHNLLIWAVGTASMLYALFGGHNVFQPDHPYDKWESAFYIGFFKFFWCVGLAWIIVACATGYGGPINTFLSWKLFGPMGRLTYCIYLCHVMVILYKLGSVRVPNYYSDYDEVKHFMGDLIISVFFAAAISILCESPLMMVEKMVFGTGKKGKNYKVTKVKTDDVEKDGMMEEERENHRLQAINPSNTH